MPDAQRNRFLRHLSFALLGLVLVVFPARAGAIHTLVSDGNGAGDWLRVSDSGTHVWLYAGQSLLHSATGGKQFTAFNVDFDHRQVHDGKSYDTEAKSTSSGLVNGGRIAYLYLSYYKKADLHTAEGNRYAQAIQLAIWDLVKDGGNGVLPGQGNFYLIYSNDKGVGALANEILKESEGHSATATWLDADGLRQTWGSENERGKSMVLITTPEPTSLALFGLGALGATGFALRRRSYS